MKVFLVEDEPMIRMMMVDMLEELGHVVTAEAGDLDGALELAQSTDCDIAILDVNIAGLVITPVAKALKARDIPIMFATGYGAAGVPENFKECPALQKPFELAALAAALASIQTNPN